MPRRKKSSNVGKKLMVAGAATLAAYYLYGANHAKAHRKKAKSWMLKAKGEALEQVERLKDMDKSDYEKIINRVESKYKKLKSVNNKELKELAHELRNHWKDIEGELKTKKSPRKTSKKKVKK
jgi:hypothetical protein